MWILFDRSINSKPDADSFFASRGIRDNVMPYTLDSIFREVGELKKDVPGPIHDNISQH